MDEHNEEKMQFRFEPEQPEAAQPPEQPQKLDKRVKRRLFALVLVMALVAAAGGSALTAAIRSISAHNAAQQAQNAQQDAQQPEEETPAPSDAQLDAAAQEEQPYRVVTAPLPRELPGHDGEKTLTPAEVYAQNVGAVVGIHWSETTELYGETMETGGSGTGFVLTEDGYILTNYHVVAGQRIVAVTAYDGTEYEAQVAGGDQMSDVALLKIEAEGLQTVCIAPDDAVVGEEVIAIGNPLTELTYTMTHGYVSAVGREVEIEGQQLHMIQTDAALNAGNSGGPLFDMNGNVIGITGAKFSGESASGVTIEGIGFAVPIREALDVVYDLQEYGYVTGRAYLGVVVRDLSAAVARDYGLPLGVRVEEVTPGSCCEQAGVQAGDILLELDGMETADTVALRAALRSCRAGQTVPLKLYRAGAELELSVTLDERPRTESDGVESIYGDSFGYDGTEGAAG